MRVVVTLDVTTANLSAPKIRLNETKIVYLSSTSKFHTNTVRSRCNPLQYFWLSILRRKAFVHKLKD